jgi:N-dimethylarginine dimethylaminohydrolase
MGAALAWGYRYLKVEPSHFRVEYQINPFMDTADQPDPVRARAQWDALVATIERHGGTVDVIAQRGDAPDMVYAMNLGLGVETADGRHHVVLSHMRYPQRRMETGSARDWFLDNGFTTSYVGQDGIGAHFEAGDAFAFGDALFVGYGPRTEELGLKHLAQDLQIRVRGFRITHPAMYHLDLAFCPLSSTRALVCPAAVDDASAAERWRGSPSPSSSPSRRRWRRSAPTRS